MGLAMTDTPAPDFELPSLEGLPEGPWIDGPHPILPGRLAICADYGSLIAHTWDKTAARAIARIPDMVREIERLRFLHKTYFADNERLRALNAELVEALQLSNNLLMLGGYEPASAIGAQVQSNRAVLAKAKAGEKHAEPGAD
jgi:hypothetical protein